MILYKGVGSLAAAGMLVLLLCVVVARLSGNGEQKKGQMAIMARSAVTGKAILKTALVVICGDQCYR